MKFLQLDNFKVSINFANVERIRINETNREINIRFTSGIQDTYNFENQTTANNVFEYLNNELRSYWSMAE